MNRDELATRIRAVVLKSIRRFNLGIFLDDEHLKSGKLPASGYWVCQETNRRLQKGHVVYLFQKDLEDDIPLPPKLAKRVAEITERNVSARLAAQLRDGKGQEIYVSDKYL